MLAAGYPLASRTHDLITYTLVLACLPGCSRGLAISVAATGSYVANAIWPPIMATTTPAHGWRATGLGIGAVMLLTVFPLA